MRHSRIEKTGSKSQSGQALVEYILLIVVVVGVILGLANQFFKPVGKWVSFYTTDYTQCLLNNGVLPGLTSSGGDNVCSKMSLAAGFGKGGSLGGSGAGGNGGSTSDSSSSKSSSGNSSGSGRINSRNKPQVGNSTRSSGGAVGNFKATTLDGPKGAEGSGAAAGAAGGKLRVQDRGSYRSFSGNQSNVLAQRGPDRSRVVGINGYLPENATVTPSVEEKAARMQQDEDERMKPVRMRLKNGPLRSAASLAESKDEFSFGSLIRYLIIGIIACALIYIVSTQVNGVVKGMEK